MENLVLQMFQTVNGVRNVMACINPRVVKLENGFNISYLEQDKTHVSLKISKDKCILFRKGIYSTHLHLNMEGDSYARITSVYGNVETEIECKEIICDNDHWSISYNIDDQQITIKWVILKN